MKLFVTGATGFIGSHFLRVALADGHAVTAQKRHEQSQPILKLEHQPTWVCSPLNEIKEGDIADADAIVHLAARGVTNLTDNLEDLLKANVLDPISLFRVAYNAGVKKLIVAGSCFEYGRSAERFDYIPPDAPLEPTNPYATSKAIASLAFQALAKELGLELTILRIFHVFGEGEHESRFWPSLRRAAITGKDFHMTQGMQVRDFIPVEILAKQLLQECTAGHAKPGAPYVHNLGTGVESTLLEFAKHWWARWNAPGRLVLGSVKYRDGEVMRYVPELPRELRDESMARQRSPRS